jgi:PAS domain S-box-containing protein
LRDERLHQSVSVKPIHVETESRCCLLQISDVSASVTREPTLRTQATKLKALMDEFKMSESRLRSILESTQDGIFTLDCDGHIESFNPAAERIFDISSDDISGKFIGDLITALDTPKTSENVLEMLLGISACTALGPVELEALRHQQKFPLEVSFGAVGNEEQRLFVVCIRDITERKTCPRPY